MCGIAGIMGFADRQTARRQIEAMKVVLRRRGPDGEGTWLADGAAVAFGHRRLSIIDLSPCGAQPMTTGDGRFTITFNGEIYNYRELREECLALGSVFQSQSDTEVAMECYRHWKVRAFSRFSGMWALAIYDREAREVLLSRDPFGIKPLYYGWTRGTLVFASEPQAFFAVDDSFREIDEATVRLFEEFGYLDRGDWTFFRRIKRFPHAHYAILPAAEGAAPLSPVRYWHPPTAIRRIARADAVEEFRRLLSRSLELHLRSDVPIGSCLSGGLDSGTIVCLGSRLLGEGNRFRTFTTRYPSLPEIDESHYAEAVISAAGARPVFFEPTLEFFRDRFQDVVACQGEPFSSTSIFAQYALYDRIGKTDVKVILDGQGADEILGGYHGYLPVFLHSLLKQGKLAQGLYEWCHLRAAYGSPLIPTFRQMARSIGARLGKGLRGAPQRAFGSAATRGPKPDGAQADECETRLRQLGHFHECGTFEETLIHLTCESNLPQLLRYEDRSSMAHSIEARVPFLEPELVSFVLSLPASLKISRGMTKSLLRDALEGILPEAVRLRRSKLGFPTPEKQWLRDAFRLDVEQAGSRAWRELAVNHWRNWLGKGSRCHAA